MSHHTQEEVKAAKDVSLVVLQEIIGASPNKTLDDYSISMKVYDDGSCVLNLGKSPSTERWSAAKKLLWSDRFRYDDNDNIVLHSCCGLVTEARKRGMVT